MISILVPIYNAAPFLPQCLDSIVGQTYSDLQIVLVDDGSKDNSLAIANEYAARDSRIEVYHQENQGVAAARNALLDKVRGEYVLFVDADDWIEPDMVGYLVRLAEKEDSDITMCGRVINDTPVSGGTPKVFALNQEQAVRDFLRHEYFNGSLCNKIIRSSTIGVSRFVKEISYGEDALFCWAVLKSVNTAVVSDKKLYHYRMNSSSLSHTSFGSSKFTAHLVWERITSEVKTSWPQYLAISRARWAIEDTLLLRCAGKSGYPCDDKVGTLQRTVSENRYFIKDAHLSTMKMRIYSYVISKFYFVAKYI